MDATTRSPDPPLPTDVATLQAMVRELLAKNQELEKQIAELKAKLDAALKHRFGRRSERRTPPPVPAAEKPPPRRDPHGRSKLPEHLERREVVHDLTDAEKLCPCCGRPRECIGEQTAEQLDLEPARFFVLRTRKKSYACQHCDPTQVSVEQRIATAGPLNVGPLPFDCPACLQAGSRTRACAVRACWLTRSPPSSPITCRSIDSPANWLARV